MHASATQHACKLFNSLLAKSHKNYKEGLGICWATRSYTSSGTLQAAQARRDRHWLPWLFLLWQELLRHPCSAMQSQFARVVKGVDLRSTALGSNPIAHGHASAQHACKLLAQELQGRAWHGLDHALLTSSGILQQPKQGGTATGFPGSNGRLQELLRHPCSAMQSQFAQVVTSVTGSAQHAASCFHSLLGQSLLQWRCSGPNHTRTTRKGLAFAGPHAPTLPVAFSKQPKQGGTATGFPGSSCSGRLQEVLRHPCSAMQSQFAQVVKGVDLRSTARKCAWA